MGSDNLFDESLERFDVFCRQHRESVTIGVYDIKNIEQAKSFGVVALDEKERVVSFEEKPEVPKSSLIAMCLYYFPKDSLKRFDDYLRESKNADAAGNYIGWLSQKEDVYGFGFEGKWFDIGSVEAYHEAQKEFK